METQSLPESPKQETAFLLPPDQSEIARHMEIADSDMTASGVRRLVGRIREPVKENLKRLKELFASAGMVAYFRKSGTGHEVAFGQARTLKPPRRWVNLVLFLATIATTLFVGSLQAGYNPLANPLDLIHGIPFSLSIILILGLSLIHI